MPYIVERFMLGWHPQKGAGYRIKLANGAWGNWVIVPAADLAALAAIFNESPVYAHEDGSITTGEEPIGD